MAEEISVAAAPAKQPKSNVPMMVMGALLLASLGATGWFWQRSTAEQAALDPRSVRSVMHLESFVVNLSGASDNAYLRVGIDLGVGTELKETEKQGASVGRLRDAILSVLATQTVEDLLTATGKAKLKQEILTAINTRVPEVRCREIYFTEFLVQR